MIADFHVCSRCAQAWPSRAAFLADPGISLIGYQVSFKDLRAGLFLFNHACGTTLALKVEAFEDLYHGPIFETPLTGTADCPEYCLRKEELRPCPARCECAFVREIIQLILARAPETLK